MVGIFAEKEMDSQGGRITLQGVTLTVPPDALTNPVAIKLGEGFKDLLKLYVPPVTFRRLKCENQMCYLHTLK